MKNVQDLEHLSLGVYPTPFYKLENISAKYGKRIWIKRDDLCGVALGGNKVRKLEYLLAKARAEGCDTVFTTGGAQSNHAMLTAACAARLGMRCILLLKKRGVTDHKGNLVLDDLYGADVRFMDTDDYQDIYDEMDRLSKELVAEGHKAYAIPCGGSTGLGAVGYARCVREIAVQTMAEGFRPSAIVSATGSGGTTAGLLVGAKRFLAGTKVIGMMVDDDDFPAIVPQLARDAAALLNFDLQLEEKDLELFTAFGAGYAIPNPEDTPYILELARMEGILLDPVYTGKAWAELMRQVASGAFQEQEDLVFVHTGGAAALFAMDLG